MKRRILVAEDNRSFRMMLTLVLSEQYDVRTVDNGIALEQELRTGDYDLLVSDLNLPLKSAACVLRGYERKDESASLIPALIVTGMEQESEEVQSVKRLVNVKDVFQKPIDMRVLKQRVDDVLNTVDAEPICSQICRAVATMPRVLVVDDEPEIRQFMYSLLDAAGIQACTCGTAAEAVQYCNRNVFDLVLLDYVLEDCLADDVLAQLHAATQGTKEPSVLIVTGFNDSINMERFAQYPMVKGIFSKPFDPSELVQKVKSLVSNPEATYQHVTA